MKHQDDASNLEVRVRVMRPEEVHLAVDWAAAEGWNPGLHDAECFYAADRQGFLVAEVNGEPVGCISAVRYEEAFGFLGLYIVLPSHRGNGYGMALWKAGMAHLASRNVGLDGVVAQQYNYRKSGFTLAHRNVRYELKDAGGAQSDQLPGADVDLVELSAMPFEELLAYDMGLFRFGREKFLRAWITRTGTVGVGALHDGQLCGYGVVRPCRTGYKIGPLFADSEEAAALLLERLRSQATDGPLYLDVPQVNAAAVALAERYSMVPMFETTRMYTAGDPGLPLNRIYGITTFELG